MLALAALVLTATASAAPPPWEWRAAAGAQLGPTSNGVVDLGVRRGPWSLVLYTDTLELRYEEAGERGRGWVAARGEAGAAGLFVARWTNGAPDPGASLLAFYAGLEGGWVSYLPHGLYAGAEASLRRWFFAAGEDTRITVPLDTWVVSPGVVLGFWSTWAEVSLRAGAELTDAGVGPRLLGEAKLRPALTLSPRVELRAGWSRDQSDITRARVGGLNPYVIPLAGAGWAEWWVERWAAVRAGPELRLPWGRVAVVLDAVHTEVVDAYGVAALARGELGALRLDVHLGWAPELVRREGVGRVSAWLLAGFDWHAL